MAAMPSIVRSWSRQARDRVEVGPGQLNSMASDGGEGRRESLLDGQCFAKTALGLFAPSQPAIGPAQSPERQARLEEDLRIAAGLAGEVAVELQRVLQQGALDRLDLRDVLEPLFADAGQHAVDGLAGLAEVGHGLEATRLGAVALVLEADVRQADRRPSG